jgi:hypothetical protein
MKVQWWMLGLMVLLPACDGDGSSTEAGGSAGSGGADGGSGGMVSSGGSGGDGGTVSSGGAGGGGAGGAGGGACSEAQTCANAAESCVYPMDSCGGTGVCQEITCDGSEPHHGPVCLCDGQIFELNAECLVWDQSLPIAPADTCSTGTYPCANATCKQHTQICVVTYDGPGSTAQGACVDVAGAPGTCLYGIADCGCLDLTALGCADPNCCSQDGFYLETITLGL